MVRAIGLTTNCLTFHNHLHLPLLKLKTTLRCRSLTVATTTSPTTTNPNTILGYLPPGACTVNIICSECMNKNRKQSIEYMLVAIDARCEVDCFAYCYCLMDWVVKEPAYIHPHLSTKARLHRYLLHVQSVYIPALIIALSSLYSPCSRSLFTISIDTFSTNRLFIRYCALLFKLNFSSLSFSSHDTVVRKVRWRLRNRWKLANDQKDDVNTSAVQASHWTLVCNSRCHRLVLDLVSPCQESLEGILYEDGLGYCGLCCNLLRMIAL